jgi:hypothetical protein
MSSRQPVSRPVIGWREWVELPSLGVTAIKAKMDTGARSSALHAVDIEQFEENGVRMVAFSVHPRQKTTSTELRCVLPLLDERPVRNSGGTTTLRPVIRTLLTFGDDSWPIDLSLIARDLMGFRLLLGREAIRRRYIIDPARSYLGRNLRG